MSSMMGMASEMDAMMSRHDANMRDAQAMDDLQSRAASHHAEMGQLLDQMGRTLDSTGCQMKC